MLKGCLRSSVLLAASYAIGLMLIAESGSPAFAQRPASTFAEIDLWQRAKASTDPAAVRAYLEKYPEGEFAPEARERLRQMGSTAPQAAPTQPPAPPAAATPKAAPAAPAPPPVQARPNPPPPPASPPAATAAASAAAPVDMTPAMVREVQQLLFDRGYAIRKVDGKSVDELKLAIVRVQQQLNQAQTGQLTQGQLAAIRRVTPPSAWSAIAYSGEGISFTSVGRPSRGIAEEEAQLACRKRTGRECHVRATWGKLCVALSYGVGVANRTRMHTTATGVDGEVQSAKDVSQMQCRGLSRFPDSCTVKRVVCADGRTEEPAPKGKSKRRT